VLMLKLLENCDRNASFAALLALLLEAPRGVAGEGDLEARWSDLVVKCLIKITKALPTTIDVSATRTRTFGRAPCLLQRAAGGLRERAAPCLPCLPGAQQPSRPHPKSPDPSLQSIDLRQLLFSIHSFFEALGVEEIRSRGGRDDKPLRMVRGGRGRRGGLWVVGRRAAAPREHPLARLRPVGVASSAFALSPHTHDPVNPKPNLTTPAPEGQDHPPRAVQAPGHRDLPVHRPHPLHG
jgi:hypothetical protein